MIEQDFVNERKKAAIQYPSLSSLEFSMLTPKYLHYQITFACLLAVSFGESTLSRERWDYMKHLESIRLARLNQFPSLTRSKVSGLPQLSANHYNDSSSTTMPLTTTTDR
jgi:hypothetical protein